MGARTRPMVVDGHSFEADLLTDEETLGKVKAIILDLLRQHPEGITDCDIERHYNQRVSTNRSVPKVTPQRLRTARAALRDQGHVVDTGHLGYSAYGNPATVWGLRIRKNEA